MAATDSNRSRAKKYADSHEAKVDRDKRKIKQILSAVDDRDDAVSSIELADIVGLEATTVRDLIKEVKQETDMPIVACSTGYYQINSVEQLERELQRIQDEIDTRKQTKRDLTRAFNRREG